MDGYELTAFEWRVIQPLLPNKPRGVPRVDDRRVLNGIFWVLRTGAPWRALPGAQPRGALLQQDQILPACRQPLRKARIKLSRYAQARMHQNLDARL